MADPNDTSNKAQEDVKNPPAAAAPAVDVQAQINRALSDHDVKREAEQGKTQELLDSKSSELAALTKRFQDSQINAALLGAAAQAVDAGMVVSLLAAACQCDENGQVTVNGKSPEDAVKALLEEKPFLAKAQGDAGSGAPQTTQGKNSMTREAFELLDVSAKSKFVRDGGVVV